MKALFILSMAVLLCSCSTKKSVELTKIVNQQEHECISSNGHLQRVGNFIYACAWPTGDDRRTCNDSSECEGICELPESAYDVSSSSVKHADGSISQPVRILRVKVGDKLQGVCSALKFKTKSTNCALLIEQGKVADAVCIE